MENFENLSKNFLIGIFDTISQPVFVKNSDGIFVYVNKAFLNFLKEKLEDVIGKKFDEKLPPEQREHFLKIDKEVLESGIENICEESLMDKFIRTTKNRLVDEYGNRFIIGNFEDITELRKDEEKILKQNKELLKLNEEKDQFISILAHDLRSPFQSFLGFIELLVSESKYMGEKEINEIYEMLLKQANRTFNLLQNLLSWIKGERGLLEPEPISFLLLPEIEKIINSVFTEIINQKRIEISVEGFRRLFVFIDIDHFNSIIRNLISNSIKFSKNGGKIKIFAERINKNEIRISITDFGIGMSKEILDVLFEFNVNKNRKGTEGESSAGLGLLNCYTLIKNNNGKIEVESEEGKGSTFHLTIPSVY